MILAEIEKRTQKPIAETFDVIAGTSTGGILALALTKPNNDGRPTYTAEQLIALYEQEGGKIFTRPFLSRIPFLGPKIRTIFEQKYLSKGIEKVLDKYFGEAHLKDALTDVIITSYEIERRKPWFFKSTKAKGDARDDFLMKQIARATSAAPTYFEPLKVETSSPSGYYAFIDGGVFANNPAMCGYVEAKTTYPDANDFLVVSLGTGDLTPKLDYEKAKGWGILSWVRKVLDVTFDGANNPVNYQLEQLLPYANDGTKRYYRFQTKLDKSNDRMDDASSKNIRALKLLAAEIIREKDRDRDLDTLCEQLVKYPNSHIGDDP